MGIVDTIFSSTWYLTIIVMVWMFLFIGLSFFKPFKNSTLNFLYKAAMFAVASLIMVLPLWFYWGLASDFNRITMGKTTLCVEETYERGGDGIPETVHRLTVLDKKTGERKQRSYIGHTGDLLGQKGDTVAFFYNYTLTLMNTATLEQLYSIDKEDWGEKFPVLKEGVSEVTANNNGNAPRRLYIVLKGKNGNTYWFEPFGQQLFDKEPTDQKILGIYSTGYDIYVECTGVEYQRTLLRQQSLPNSTRSQILPGERYARLFGSPGQESFIAPVLMCTDTARRFFVFSHYTTTDKENIWVEAKDFQFKTLWKKSSTQLEAADSYNHDVVHVYLYENGLLYFNMGGFMLCMEPLSGKTVWKVRL